MLQVSQWHKCSGSEIRHLKASNRSLSGRLFPVGGDYIIIYHLLWWQAVGVKMIVRMLYRDLQILLLTYGSIHNACCIWIWSRTKADFHRFRCCRHQSGKSQQRLILWYRYASCAVHIRLVNADWWPICLVCVCRDRFLLRTCLLHMMATTHFLSFYFFNFHSILCNAMVCDQSWLWLIDSIIASHGDADRVPIARSPVPCEKQ